MSGPTTISMIFAIAIPNMALWVLLDHLLKRRTQEIVLGVVDGIPLSQRDRRLMFHTSWAIAIAVAVGSQSVFTVGYWLLSIDASTQNAKRFAQLYAFYSSIGALVHMIYGSLWFTRLRGLLYPPKATTPHSP